MRGTIADCAVFSALLFATRVQAERDSPTFGVPAGFAAGSPEICEVNRQRDSEIHFDWVRHLVH